VAREKKMSFVCEIIIEGGFAYACGSTHIGCRGGAISLFKEKPHGDIENVVFMDSFFLHIARRFDLIKPDTGLGLSATKQILRYAKDSSANIF